MASGADAEHPGLRGQVGVAEGQLRGAEVCRELLAVPGDHRDDLAVLLGGQLGAVDHLLRELGAVHRVAAHPAAPVAVFRDLLGLLVGRLAPVQDEQAGEGEGRLGGDPVADLRLGLERVSVADGCRDDRDRDGGWLGGRAGLGARGGLVVDGVAAGEGDLIAAVHDVVTSNRRYPLRVPISGGGRIGRGENGGKKRENHEPGYLGSGPISGFRRYGNLSSTGVRKELCSRVNPGNCKPWPVKDYGEDYGYFLTCRSLPRGVPQRRILTSFANLRPKLRPEVWPAAPYRGLEVTESWRPRAT